MSLTAQAQMESEILNGLSKSFKDSKSGSAFRPGDIHLNSYVPYGISPGIAQFDLALGRPGVPAGRVIEIYGFEGCGKSSLALTLAAGVQQMGGLVFWQDTESSWDNGLAISRGVNPESGIILTQVGSIEGIFRQQEAILKELSAKGWKRPVLIVTDSITSSLPEQELKGEMVGDMRVGGEAKTIRRGIRRVWYKLAKQRIPLVYINHAVATNITAAFGKKSGAAGGHGIKFASALRIEMKQVSQLLKGKGTEQTRQGIRVLISFEKWKLGVNAQPKFEIDLLDASGFDKGTSLMEAYKEIGVAIGVSKEDLKMAGPDYFRELYQHWWNEAGLKGLVKPWGGQDNVENTGEDEEDAGDTDSGESEDGA